MDAHTLGHAPLPIASYSDGQGPIMSHVHGGPRSAAYPHRRRLLAVLVLTLVVLAVEVVGAMASNSLALLADAGHLFTDAVGIGLALGAVWLGGRPATGDRTFGYLRLEILAAVLNAALLVGIAIVVIVEAVQRLTAPPEIATGLMIAVATVGLVANAISLVALHRPQRSSLNMRGAYLEVTADLGGSIAVIVAGLVIGATGWTGADAVASGLIGLLILPRAWTLLREAVDILLEATPKGIVLDDVRQHILDAAGVLDVHDLHAWTITSGMDVVSAHVVIEDGADPRSVLDELCRCLSGDFDIDHSTFQLESADRRRLEAIAHA